MKPLTREDLVDLESYRGVRDAYRGAVIDYKRRRRMAVGDRVTLLFEDRETLRFQVLEMLLVERIEAPEKVQHELDVYNELMPRPDELSATLFLEITDAKHIRAELDRLIGLDEQVSLEIGDGTPLRVPARFDPQQLAEDRISAVHYLRFPLGADAARRFLDPESPAAIRIDHPACRVRAAIPPEVRESLIAGLREHPPPLLDPSRVRAAAAREQVLEETPHARVVAPSRPAVPGHRVVLLRAPGASLLRVPDEAWQEIMRVVREHARQLRETHGACRIVAEVGDETLPARIDLLPVAHRA